MLNRIKQIIMSAVERDAELNRRKRLLDLNPPKATLKMRLYKLANGSDYFRGTISPEGDWSIGSRQVRRAAMRRVYFNQVTQAFPDMSRSERRRYARLQTKLKYREASAALRATDTIESLLEETKGKS